MKRNYEINKGKQMAGMNCGTDFLARNYKQDVSRNYLTQFKFNFFL